MCMGAEIRGKVGQMLTFWTVSKANMILIDERRPFQKTLDGNQRGIGLGLQNKRSMRVL